MVSSLPVGARRYRGPQQAPFGSSGSFLSPAPPGPTVGASDLATLLNMYPGSVMGATMAPSAHALPCAPLLRPQVQPWSAHEAAFAGVGGPQLSNAPPAVGMFDIRHIGAGRFTEETIKNMHKAVIAAKTDAEWRELMEQIRQEGRRQGAIGWKDYLGEIRWFDHWYRNVHPIDYVRDPHQVELVMHPKHTYRKSLGDCDDSATLWAASLGALGAPHRFRTYKADPGRPKDWSHVVSQVWVPAQGWVNNDLTIRGAVPGFEPGGFSVKDWTEPRW
jgi:hypothetical protein